MKKFILKGNVCPHCASKIENELKNNDQVKNMIFDKVNFTIQAEGDNIKDIIVEAVNKYEPGVEVIEEGGGGEAEEPGRREKLLKYSLIIGCIFVIFSLFLKNDKLAIIGAVFAGAPIVIDGLKIVLNGGGLDEKFLMSISMIGAIIIGQPLEGAMIMILYRLGEALSDYALKKASEKYKRLAVSQKLDVRVIGEDGVSKLVDVESVEIGTKILVHPHEMVPLDSEVLDEYIVVDNSSFTGESDPIVIKKGETVMAGAILVNNPANLKTLVDHKNSSLSRMNNLLERAEASKSKQEKFMTTFSKVYTPIVVGLAIIVALIPLVNGGDFKEYIYKSLAFLVVSCPCALVLGVPLSYAVGIASLSTKGVLMKGSEYIDTLSHVEYLAMDKTGTVTENYMEIESVECPADIDEAELRRLMAIGEKFSTHPIAQAFKLDNVPDPEDYKEIVGQGIDFAFEGKSYKIRGGAAGGQINLIRGEEIVGEFFMIEKLKDKINETIDKLHDLNVKAILVSGDSEEKVSQVADYINIDKYYAGQSPEDKLNVVHGLKAKGKIGFVGDGINDSPVLKAADVGISMGNMGSDAAVEASDVVITDDSIYKVATTIGDARKIIRNVKFIIGFVLAVKIITMILIYLGYGGMYMAVFADVGVSLISIGIALMNLKIRNKKGSK